MAPPSEITSTPARQIRWMRSGRSTGIQSPDISTVRSPQRAPSGRAEACSTSIAIRAGTEFHTVTPWASISSHHRPGSRLVPRSGRTSVPPAPSTPNTSNTDRSKLSEDSPSTASEASMPKRSQTSTLVFTAAACDTATPLGAPVDPEV